MSSSPIIQVQALSFPWQTIDPFLFCVHHNDAYPAGDAGMAPQATLAGHNIGQELHGAGAHLDNLGLERLINGLLARGNRAVATSLQELDNRGLPW